MIVWVSISNEPSTNPQNHTTMPFGTGAAGLSAFGTDAAQEKLPETGRVVTGDRPGADRPAPPKPALPNLTIPANAT